MTNEKPVYIDPTGKVYRSLKHVYQGTNFTLPLLILSFEEYEQIKDSELLNIYIGGLK